MAYLTPSYSGDRAMKIALTVACAVHLALIIGVRFDPTEAYGHAPQIDVTLAVQPSRTAPDNARHVAQANQRGEAERAEFPSHSAPAERPSRASAARSGRDAMPTTRAETSRQSETASASTDLEGISPEVDELSRKLNELEAQLDQQNQAISDLPRVRRLTSVAARQSADAAYLQQWRQRVEAVGNKYYPEASVRYGIYGSLRLLVVIRHDGRLEDIRVLSSSGFAVLDEAAQKIVRMAAPFSPFPQELRAIADRVEIIRTWQFEENRLSSG